MITRREDSITGAFAEQTAKALSIEEKVSGRPKYSG